MAVTVATDRARRGWFYAGLFTATAATLALEVLDTRFLSVMTWYHISFFAVSIAMFGMSVGAVHVYLGAERFQGDLAADALARFARYFAASIPICHMVALCIPIEPERSLTAATGLTLSVATLSVPFCLAGVLVSIALTRVPGAIGRTYATDMVGAALGSLSVIPLLRLANLSSAVFATGVLAFVSAYCFARFARAANRRGIVVLTVAVAALAVLNALTLRGFRLQHAKGAQPSGLVAFEGWNTYSQIVALRPGEPSVPFYWGVHKKPTEYKVRLIMMAIDGQAGTMMTEWNGDPQNLDWVAYDVTSLAYHLRKRGDAAVIGVGGGRDILTALWANSPSITGVELNPLFVHLLEGPYRRFAGIADRPEVKLVTDEARSYMTRTPARFDVLQMALIDTWASTGAGAFTLSENGLYTLEAWKVFLGVLKPTGLFSVSRWFSPEKVSETSRVVALGTAALLAQGITDPAAHLALVSCNRVATLLLSPTPLRKVDLAAIDDAVERYGFSKIVVPGTTPALPLLGKIVSSRSLAELQRTVASEPFDYTPPTDQRPYFFNMFKPTMLLGAYRSSRVALESAGVVWMGNLVATGTLALLGIIALLLVAMLIFVPLWRAGLPDVTPGTFTAAATYFGLIGTGYMLVQVPFMQRFSVYLGHPTYSIAVILFSMILFTGIGSMLSDSIELERRPSLLVAAPVATAAWLLLLTLTIQPIIDSTIQWTLGGRCLVVVALAASISLLLGLWFPLGLRLLTRVSDRAAPWMWGINGACGVMASIVAVAVSIWFGIDVSLFIAVSAYAALALPARTLWTAGGVRPATEAARPRVAGLG